MAAIGSSLENEGIGVDGSGTRGSVTGGAMVNFASPAIQQYARENAEDEAAHVKFLRTAITEAGGQPVARPQIDISAAGAFDTAASAAMVSPANGPFNPYTDEISFMLGAYIFEDVGVTAYKGASPLVQNKTFLEAAAGTLAAEAYHAGLVRGVLYGKGVEMPSAMIHETTVAISNARDSLDGDSNRDQGVVEINQGGNIVTASATGQMVNKGNIVPLDENGIAYSRTPEQVLNIVYLNTNGDPSMGFFPNGVNGNINLSPMANGS